MVTHMLHDSGCKLGKLTKKGKFFRGHINEWFQYS
jgi:hypothetical protein